MKRMLDGLRQTRLRRAAVRYAEHGWDVVPGAVRCGDRFRCVTQCPTMACHPDWAGWEQTATRDRADVVLHGAGSWVPAPPTLTLEGRVRWLVDPEEVSWRLPDGHAVQAGLARALPVPARWPVPRPAAA